MPKFKYKIPNKAWEEFTPPEQKRFKPLIDCVSIKDECHGSGPVYVIFKERDQEPGQFWECPISRPRSLDGEEGESDRHPGWFSQNSAKRFAQCLGVELKES